MAFAEDRTVFFRTADFATAALYKALGQGAGVTINVIFDAPNQEHLGITGTNPTALVNKDDIASFSNTDTLTIGATVYRFVNDEPEDDGNVLRIQLEKQ